MITAQADIAEELIVRQLKIKEKVTILAHDYGVTVAQELIARHNESESHRADLPLASVAFLNGGLFPECHRPIIMQTLMANKHVGPILCRLSSEGMFKKNFSAIFGNNTKPSEHEMKEFWALIKLQDGQLRFTELLSYMAQRRLHRERWVGALVDTLIPLVFINGLSDPISGAHMAHRYREVVPGARVAELGGIGHYPQWEDAPAVFKAFSEWQGSIYSDSKF